MYRDNQRWDVFKNNQTDPTLNTLTKNKNGGYPGASYYLGIKAGSESTDYAVHMHVKIKLRDNVTREEAAQYGRVYAATTTKRKHYESVLYYGGNRYSFNNKN